MKKGKAYSDSDFFNDGVTGWFKDFVGFYHYFTDIRKPFGKYHKKDEARGVGEKQEDGSFILRDYNKIPRATPVQKAIKKISTSKN